MTAQLKKQLDDYLNANKIAGTTTSVKSASYTKIDNKIVGVYSVTYTYSSSSSNSSGPVDCQTYDFNIPA